MNSFGTFSLRNHHCERIKKSIFYGLFILVTLTWNFDLTYGEESSSLQSPFTAKDVNNTSLDGRSSIELPDISSNEQKLALLIAIKQNIPNLFIDAAKYDIDLFNLLDDERALLKNLKEDPNLHYVDHFANKDYHEISIIPPKHGIPIGEETIKPEALQAWKDELQQTLESLGSEGSENTSQRAAITSGLISEKIRSQVNQILSNESTDPYVSNGNAFLEKLVKNDREFMSQFNLKKRESGADTLDKRLKVALEILTSRDPPNTDVIHKLQQISDHEKAIQNSKSLVILKAIFDQKEKDHGAIQSFDKASEYLDHLSSHDLNFYHKKPDTFRSVIQEFLPDHTQSVESQILKSIQKNINSYATQIERAQERATKPVYLTQQQPVIGIFRGCTGGDCSSQYSFPYPNDPNERVFFIKEKGKKKVIDAEGHESEVEFEKVKGYVSATEVMANGKPSLYVITVSGNHVSAGDTELILRGLEQLKDKLGFDQILLPAHDKVESLNNFAAPRSVYNRYTANQEPVKITYNNTDIRRKIQNFESIHGYNQGEYDHMENNDHAVVLNFSKSEHGNVETLKIIKADLPHELFQTKPLKEIPKAEILEFFIDLLHSGRTEVASKLMEIHHIENEVASHEVLDFLDFLNSGVHKGETLSVHNFKSQIKNSLVNLGINSEFLVQRPHFIYPGILHCTDGFSPENIEETTKFVLKDITDEKLDKDKEKIIFPHLEKIRNTDAARAWYQKQKHLLASSIDHYEKIAVLDALSTLPPKDVTVEREILKILSHPTDTYEKDLLMQWAVYSLKKLHSSEESTQNGLRELILRNTNPEVRAHALDILMESPASLNFKNETIAHLLPSEHHIEPLNRIAKYVIEQMHDPAFIRGPFLEMSENIEKLRHSPETQSWLTKQSELLVNSKNLTDKIAALRSFALFSPENSPIENKVIKTLADPVEESTHHALKELVLRHHNPEVSRHALDILLETPTERDLRQEVLIQVLKKEYSQLFNRIDESNMKMKAISLLIQSEPYNFYTHRAITHTIKNDSDPRLRFTALEELGNNWKKRKLLFDHEMQKAIAAALTDAYPSVNSQAANFLKLTQQRWPNADFQYEILKAWARSLSQSKDEILKKIPLPHIWPFQKSQFLQLLKSVENDEEFKLLLNELNRYAKSKPGNLQNMQELLQAEVEYFHEATGQRKQSLLDVIHQSNLNNPLLFQHSSLSIKTDTGECFPPRNATAHQIEQFLLSLRGKNSTQLGENSEFDCAKVTTRINSEKNQLIQESNYRLPLPPKPNHRPPPPPTEEGLMKNPTSNPAK